MIRVNTAQLAAGPPRPAFGGGRLSGVARRRRVALLEVLGATVWCIGGYHLLIEPTRRLEVGVSGAILHLFGVSGISAALGNAFIVFGPQGPMVAVLTPSCSALTSLLALSALALVVLRERTQALTGFLAAALWVLAANQVRLLSSLLAGRYFSLDTLLWFHDWVGAALNFIYTLVGLLIMIALTMHTPERAEQDKAGRHTARRPDAWARPGLGYRTELDSLPPPPRFRPVSLIHRYLLPREVSRRLAALRERGRVDYRIGHLPPDERAEAVRALAERGLAVHTATLVAVATNDDDERVLDALADVVAARQWEPASDKRILGLRLWARAWLMRRQAGDGSAATAAAPNADAAPAAKASPSVPVTGTDAAVDGGDPVPQADGIPSAARLVAVTGAGGPAGVAVIRALQAAGERVLALDANPDAVGLRLAGEFAVLPRADEDGYGDELLRVIDKHRPAALICTVAEEYAALRAVVPELDERGCRTWIPSAETTEACLDKARFADVLHDHGVPHPSTARTAAVAVAELPGPWVVKPARGRGSRDVVYAKNRTRLKAAFTAVPSAIAQTQLTGREFTADVLVGRDGQVLTCVPRWRDETKAGISVRGTTFDSTAVTTVVAAAVHAVGLTGPANVQGFVAAPEVLDSDPDVEVDVTVVEINPRFSGGLPLTLAAGADVVSAYLAGILDPDARLSPLAFLPGVRMARYFAEVYYTADGGPLADPLAPQPAP